MTPSIKASNAAFPFEDSIRFIYALAMAIEQYAGHSHDTDQFLHRIIRVLELHANIHATPNSMVIGLWQEDELQQKVFTVTKRNTQYDMSRLSEIMEVAAELEDRRISPAQGLARLQRIEAAPALYGSCYNALTFLGSGMAFGVIMGLPWLDVLLGGFFGLTAYGSEVLARRIPGTGYALEFLVAAASAFLAAIAAFLSPGIHAIALTICAIIIYVPGFGLTIAPREIVLGDTLSGIIYFTNAFFVSIKLLFGAFAGFGIAGTLFVLPAVEKAAGVPHLFTWIFAPILPLCIAIQFGVSPRRLWLVVSGALLVWAGVQLGGLLGSWQGAFLGAVILAVFSKLAALRFKTTSLTVILPVVMILVPGFAFVSFLYTLQTQGIIVGIDMGLQVFATLAAIIGGFFLGEFIVSAVTPKKK